MGTRYYRSAVDGSGARVLAAVHFAAAGLLLATLAAWIAIGYQPAAVMDAVTTFLVDRFGKAETLRAGSTLAYLGPTAATVIGLVAAIAAPLQFVAAASTLRNRHWKRCVGCGAVGAATLVAFPLAFVAVTLVILSRSEFE